MRTNKLHFFLLLLMCFCLNFSVQAEASIHIIKGKVTCEGKGCVGEKALGRGRARLDAVFRSQAAPHSGDADAAKRRGRQGRAGGSGPRAP